MKNPFGHLFVSCLLAGALAGGAFSYAAGTNSTSNVTNAAKAKDPNATGKTKRDWYPFGGIIAAVDKQANTISLKKKKGERVLTLDSKSQLEINGKPVTLESVKVGDYAHGKLHKDSSGKEVITAAKFDKERSK
jgi:hypothetical protein